MSLRFTSATDYAVRAMIHLACLPEGVHVLRGDIATAQKVPTSFMAKILRSLVHAQLLTSIRGVRGGFALARSTDEITLLDIVEAIDGPIRLVDCTGNDPHCAMTADCPAAPVWNRVQSGMRKVLAEYSLEDLVSAPRRDGKVIPIPHRARGPVADRSEDQQAV